jgi:hypothetical protein
MPKTSPHVSVLAGPTLSLRGSAAFATPQLLLWGPRLSASPPRSVKVENRDI